MVKKIYSILISMIAFCLSTTAGLVEIKPIQRHLLEEARFIIYHAAFEPQLMSSLSVNDVIRQSELSGLLCDMDDIESIEQTYTNNNGIFLAPLKNNVLAGIGAIRNLDNESCELTRMFFKPQFRNKGLGAQLLEQLELFAKKAGYKKIKLNVWNSETQAHTLEFYKKSGFSGTKPYKSCLAKIFMEKGL